MKVLLVSPSSQGDVYGGQYRPNYPPPLGLAYIASALEEAGHEVAIVDIDTDGITKENFITIISSGYGVVGFSATTPVYNNAEKLCKVVKENTSAITVLGGIHATLLPQECARSKWVDFVVQGEGEITVVDLMCAISGEKPYCDVKGISFKQNGSIISTPKRELIGDINSVPFPARHLFRKKKYCYPGSVYSPVMPIITSRGCPHDCTYCCTKKIYENSVRFRSAVDVVEEIEHLIKEYGVKEIDIWDDNFTMKRSRIFEIRDELKKRNLKTHFIFPNGLRADRVDEEVLTCLKEMGACNVVFGVESGNQDILDKAKKGIKLNQIEKAYHLAKKVGFETWGFFILGLPGETEETLRDTINFAKKIDPDIAKFHILKPFPGTEVFEQLKEQGLILNFDYSRYSIHSDPVHELPGLSDEALKKWQKKFYKEFYLRPSKIFRLLFRSKLWSWERVKRNIQYAFSFYKFLRRNRKEAG